jgi:hypothetical protein
MAAPAGTEYIYNEAGLRQTKSGTFVFPWTEVKGKWVEVAPPPGGWATRPLVVVAPDPTTLRPSDLKLTKAASRKHNETVVQNTIMEEAREEIVKDGVRLVIHSPWNLNADGMIEVKVKAFDAATGRHLYVHDGTFQFINVRQEQDILSDLIGYIRRTNGMEES